jgi:hypothetical protein
VQFQISVLDVGLTEVEQGLFHEFSPHCREGAVRSHDQISTFCYSLVSFRPVKDGKFSVNAKMGLV